MRHTRWFHLPLLILMSLLGLASPAQGVDADLVSVTVQSDESILVTWLLPDGPTVTRQELQRLKAGTTWEAIATPSVGETSYLDLSVHPVDSLYAYRLLTEDVNGEIRFSNEGQNMRLVAERLNTGIQLTWNPYIFWARDVEEYRIYVLVTRGYDPMIFDWELLATVPAGTLSYLDQTPYLPPRVICYKVEAHEREGNRATSTSNEACQPAGLIIPNTYSPNGDGINDFWWVEGLELYGNTNCKVYDRWGRKVFESDLSTFSWGGNDLTGLPCADGAYYYTLELGSFGEMFKGYIMLLR